MPGIACSGLRRHHFEVEQAVKEDSGGEEEASPPRPASPTHPSGVVVDVVGMSRGNHGCSCGEHPDGCDAAVLMDDIVVHI